MARSLDDTPTRGMKIKWTDFVEKFNFKKDDWHVVRFFGPVWIEYRHTIETLNGKFYPEYCHGWDVDKGDFFPDKEDRCPVCALIAADSSTGKKIKSGYRYIMNLMDSELEDSKPQNPKPNWTPVRLADLAVTAFTKIKELKQVNKGVSVDNAKHGAMLQIKYNPDTDPTKQYNVSMDTKDIAITEAQAEYTVLQKFPDGTSKIVKGKDGLPAYFEYIRCVNSREDMVRSLRTHGYYGKQEEETSPLRARGGESLSREEKVARVDAEAPIETVLLDADFSPVDDEEPTPKKKAVVETKKSNEPYDDCPTGFGEFAAAVECYTQCGVVEKCREATEFAAKKKEEKPAKKKVQEHVPNDDDDTV